jgi:hypothetical protein
MATSLPSLRARVEALPVVASRRGDGACSTAAKVGSSLLILIPCTKLVPYLNAMPFAASGLLLRGSDEVNDPGDVLHNEVSMGEVILRSHAGQNTCKGYKMKL